MKLIKLIFLIHFLVFGNFTISQENLDSLFGVWNDESKADTSRLNAMYNIAWNGYLFTKPDSAFYYAQLEYEFAQKVDNKNYMSHALNTQGVSFYLKSNYEKALQYYEKSLKILKEIRDKNRVGSTLGNIALVYENQGNYGKALLYHEKSLKIREEIADKRGIAGSYNLIGNIYAGQGNFEKALEHHEKSLKIREEIADKIGIGNSLGNIGIIYKEQGNNEKAIEFYKNSLKIFKEIGYKKGIGSCYNNIGNIYQDQGYYEKSLVYFRRDLKICEEIGDKKGIGGSYNNIGLNYENQGNYEKALENFEKSLKICKEIGDKSVMGISLGNIGLIYKNQGNNEKALEYFGNGLKICEEIGDKNGVGYSFHNIGLIYKQENNYEKALDYLLESKKIKEEINVINDLDETAKALMEVYEKLGNNKKALENHKLYVKVKDSLDKMDAEKQLYKFEIDKNYELEKQADSIKHADEIILHQAEAITQKQRSNGLVLISIIILISLGLVFNQLKKVKKGKLLVEERNIVIEEKQKEITESINYAKRLQDGILVPLDLVQSWLSESFILFKPKDIVSGDFYWIEKVGDKIYFAVADCTGHGIPGALVSIICSNALSKSLQEDNISSPAKLLDATRKLVEERFVRAADSIKDGMDISLSCLNVKTKTITWSGAMNPLWVVKKDAKEIQELKPDRQAIGMVENPKPFTEHKFKIALGDSVYLFSDGYPDQFGGPKGKKYMKGKMKKFVLSLQNQSMQEQLVSFDKEFNSWKGNRDQIDDVCVMGVRIT